MQLQNFQSHTTIDTTIQKKIPLYREEVVQSVSLFAFLFFTLALLHAAEIAITTLYPWKVREFAEEEEKMNTNGRGVFKILNEDITRVLTTILVTSTACSIYGKDENDEGG